ncbi:hypothetical protein QQP08_020552 [Theobroma cacao]|uniref:Uncharacterized protein n=1 Tax=Theobroma cacao TaxID=3641 RepID=A0A061FBB7_THECC|nr:Uncharacterized protein TCM_033113 [Theobroma cacao]WRX28065.1 hypothetical protein QQP08_020552 [Theobroma cacao]
MAPRQMASKWNVPIKKSLMSLKKRVRVYSWKKGARRSKAELAAIREEMQHTNVELARLLHQLVQRKQLIRSVARSNTLVNHFVETTIASWED